MTKAENSLRIINSLPGRITYKGNYYCLAIGRLKKKWFIEYYRVFKDKILFSTSSKKIEKAIWEMYEILTENKLILK